MVNKHIVGLAGLLLMATSASSLADSGHQSIHERVVERILKPCEGKKPEIKWSSLTITAASMRLSALWRQYRCRSNPVP